jgi:hypothetical protein
MLLVALMTIQMAVPDFTAISDSEKQFKSCHAGLAALLLPQVRSKRVWNCLDLLLKVVEHSYSMVQDII